MSVDLWIPREIEFVGGLDWGYLEPGCLGWAACLPQHRLHILHEWKFKEHADEDISAGYLAHTKALGLKGRVRYVAGDPSMWIRDGRNARRGQSRAETLMRAGMPLRKAENAREDGWARLHSLLRVPRDAEGRQSGEPLLTIDETCVYLRRSFQSAQSDKLNADDVNTRSDDHGLDMTRYIAMSRPSPAVRWQDDAPPKGTMGALLHELRNGLGRQAVLGAGNVRGAA